MGRRPGTAIAALTAACLIAFAVTVPLPRADGQLVGSDGTRYYVYLPSLVLDRDLDFGDEYAYFYAYDPVAARHAVKTRTATGLPENRFGIGPAILWAPFFLAAHALALLLAALGVAVATDGYGYLYQAPVLAGSIVYGGLGAWLSYRAARRIADERAALAATVAIVLAGNAVYYLTVEPSMSHPLSTLASSAFFLLWLHSRSRPGRWRWLGLGALAGLMALIRPQDGLFLALPIADRALAARHRGGGWRAWRAWLRETLAMLAAALAAFVPQLVVWQRLHGGFLRSGYQHEFDTLFHWTSPRLLATLFSAERGLLVWHPVFLLALAGLGFVPRSRRRLAALGAAGFAIQWYVISSWHDWRQGDAFGGRMFIVCTPIFVLGLAALLERARGTVPRGAMVAAGTALIALNLLLLIHYRLELLFLERPLTFADLTLGRLAPLCRLGICP